MEGIVQARKLASRLAPMNIANLGKNPFHNLLPSISVLGKEPKATPLMIALISDNPAERKNAINQILLLKNPRDSKTFFGFRTTLISVLSLGFPEKSLHKLIDDNCGLEEDCRGRTLGVISEIASDLVQHENHIVSTNAAYLVDKLIPFIDKTGTRLTKGNLAGCITQCRLDSTQQKSEVFSKALYLLGRIYPLLEENSKTSLQTAIRYATYCNDIFQPEDVENFWKIIQQADARIKVLDAA